ncbi:sigma factor-like helix-turn-helix DNA-binding protein [Streptomyces violaceoruber]
MARKVKTPSAHYMEQAQQAHELALGGMGYRQIAEKMGVSLGTVQNRLKLYREEISAPRLEDLRNRQLARIEMGIRALWPMYLKADKDAINGMVALMKREADLLGLNAATAFKVEATINTHETDALDVQRQLAQILGTDCKTIPGEVVTSRGYTRPHRPLAPNSGVAATNIGKVEPLPEEFADDNAFQPHEVRKEAVRTQPDVEPPRRRRNRNIQVARPE